MLRTLKNKLGIDISLPIFFVDSHYRSQDPMERRHFENETSKLWKFIEKGSIWQSLTKSDIEKSMRKVRKKFGEIKEKYVYDADACPVVENIELKDFSFRCIVFTEDQLIIDARRAKNNFKIEAQRTKIKTLRGQIDILKNKCF